MPLPTEREWISLEHGGESYMFDLTFLLSNWNCIFGRGCKGIREEDTTELSEGCCTFGAHFSDAADRKRVLRMAERLTTDQWQFKDEAEELGGPVERQEKKVWTTRIHEDACIFLNRPDFHLGAGCALHVGAVQAAESFLDWKPEVCWQVPLRLGHHTDESGYLTWTLTDWKRRDWGEGGAAFHWWCTDTDDAFTGTDTVLVTMHDEIVALVGEEVYDRLVHMIAERPAAADPVARKPSAEHPVAVKIVTRHTI